MRVLTPEESNKWLLLRMKELDISSLTSLAELTGLNKGTLSKYFWQKQRPSVEVLPILCSTLQVSPEGILVALGVIPKASD